jgi:hypothetical protein
MTLNLKRQMDRTEDWLRVGMEREEKGNKEVTLKNERMKTQGMEEIRIKGQKPVLKQVHDP